MKLVVFSRIIVVCVFCTTIQTLQAQFISIDTIYISRKKPPVPSVLSKVLLDLDKEMKIHRATWGYFYRDDMGKEMAADYYRRVLFRTMNKAYKTNVFSTIATVYSTNIGTISDSTDILIEEWVLPNAKSAKLIIGFLKKRHLRDVFKRLDDVWSKNYRWGFSGDRVFLLQFGVALEEIPLFEQADKILKVVEKQNRLIK